ncbi:alpha-(1,3)-fucosyltransferase 10 [Bacillus rossius redtenbacheri]|uniref:alpha-(1,3)-fucosyltransferase 10 n=1 Tax=Bacillus rossius redtenbacheri TaxID=93214 RepID=UPI002FDEDBDE
MTRGNSLGPKITTVEIYLENFDTELYEEIQRGTVLKYSDVKDPVVLWWTPFTGEPGTLRQCGDSWCYVTDDRQFFHDGLARAVLFYGSRLDLLDLPRPRDGPRLLWALLHEESPKNVPALCHEALLSLFNHSSTFSRHSDVPLTLQYLGGSELLATTKYVVATAEKDALLGELAPVLYIQSSCDAPSGRDSYVRELGRYIGVDSYGKCLQNKKLPENIANHSEGQDSEDFLNFMARYKFTLALENAVCEDYITEKLWRPLVVGSVPVYMGSPSVRDWLPNNESAILVSDFNSPRDLARHLLALNVDTAAYERHLQHKAGRVENRRLLSALDARPPGSDWGRYVQRLECLVCERLGPGGAGTRSVVGPRQYDCPEPRSPLTGRRDELAPWNQVWQAGRCEASLSRSIALHNRTVSREEYSERLLQLLQSGEC